MEFISAAIIPLMLVLIIGMGAIKKVGVFDCFIGGARDGLETAVRILPSLIALLTAITMFQASGALDFIVSALAPPLALIGFPKEAAPLALMRPVSGSGALAIVKDLLTRYGADSWIGRTASVMMGSTETTFYTLAVYFGCVHIKDTRYTVKAALLADLSGMLASVYVVKLFFY